MTSINGEGGYNVIPSSVTILGTLRAFTEATISYMTQRIEEVPFLYKFSRNLALWDVNLFFIIAKMRCLTSLSVVHKVWRKVRFSQLQL